jgi:hypothetical protein
MASRAPTYLCGEGRWSAQNRKCIVVKSPEDVRPHGHEDGEELRPGEKLTIVIDANEYRAPTRKMTGAQLRRLAEPNIGPKYDLWQEVPGGEDNLVDDKERVTLADRMGFYSSSSEINPG